MGLNHASACNSAATAILSLTCALEAAAAARNLSASRLPGASGAFIEIGAGRALYVEQRQTRLFRPAGVLAVARSQGRTLWNEGFDVRVVSGTNVWRMEHVSAFTYTDAELADALLARGLLL